MQTCTFRIFKQTDEVSLIRFEGPGGQSGQRPLDPAEVAKLIAEVAKSYAPGSDTLPGLGRRLYNWLDGPTERWLAQARQGGRGLAVRIDAAGRLRHLPWELLHDDTGFLAALPNRPFSPVRLVSGVERTFERANRPLRVLFMACSPTDVEPVLDFEAEESLILGLARQQSLELWVEESGSLKGLGERVEEFGPDYFDLLHLTGHADIKDGVPVFITEDDLGFRREATAEDIASVFGGRWPRLVFLSGCRTGQMVQEGALPSLAEALVPAGAPAVLGWALPVGDRSASAAAAVIYRELALGGRIDRAVAKARVALIEADIPDWHLLRLYAEAGPLDEMVTTLKTKGRARLKIREAQTEFLDAGAKVEVCPAERFVGRRRPLQRCLRVLRSAQGQQGYAEGVLIFGLGGQGKSSLAARLCQRLPDYKRLVWVGQVDENQFIRLLGDRLDSQEAIGILNTPKLSLVQRLRRLLDGPLGSEPVLFVFDDFEHSLDLAESEAARLKPEALEVLAALLAAIRETVSESRVIVTSRHDFPLPGPAGLHRESLERLRGADEQKKLRFLAALREGARTDEELRGRAVGLAAGNPRLMEWLNLVLADESLDQEAILAALEGKAEEFRESVLLLQILAQQAAGLRRLLGLAAVFGLPVDRAALVAAAGGEGLVANHLERAASLGLIEAGTDPASGQARYYVSPILHPLLEQEISDQERIQACRQGARHLYVIFEKQGRLSETEMLECHRLAFLAQDQELAATIADRIASAWINRSRFREAKALCQVTLTLGPYYRLFHQLARAEEVLGETESARRHYQEALAQCPSSVSERPAILHNLAGILAQQGQVEEALKLYEECLELEKEIRDVQGKAATLHQMASILAQQGQVEEALRLYKESLELKEKIGNVQGKAATLHEMAGIQAQQGQVEEALRLYKESLELKEKIGNVQGKAATLHEMAGIQAQQGQVEEALKLYRESLELEEKIGNVQGKAATLHEMAGIRAQQGQVEEALRLYKESLELKEKIGNVQGKAATLHQMASILAQQGQVEEALRLYKESLEIEEKIGDVRGKAATLHQMASILAQQGQVEEALRLYKESLELKEKIGDVRGKAATLHEMACILAQQGQVEEALRLYKESLELKEKIGDVRGKAATLANMAWLAGRQGDAEKQRELNLAAARALASIRAWPDLATVLGNLSQSDALDAAAFLSQAVWLSLRVTLPLEDAVMLCAALVGELGPAHSAAPLAATTGNFLAVRAEGHPKREEMLRLGAGMLSACVQARKVPPEKAIEWIKAEGLNDPGRFLPALNKAIEEIVGDQWLFDRSLVG